MASLGQKFSKAEKRGRFALLAKEIHKAAPDMKRIEELLEGTDLKMTDCAGNTLLHEAASAGKADIVRLLVKHKANVNARNSESNTPLIYAVFSGREDIVRYLLEHGAVKTYTNALGRSAGDYAREKHMMGSSLFRT